MGAHAPQWLFTSFVEAMTQIGATAPAPVLAAEARDLVSRWNAPGRPLHNTQHLIDILAHIDELSSSAHDPDLLRVAYWYHGAYLAQALEVRIIEHEATLVHDSSTAKIAARLHELGVSEEVVERIAELLTALVTGSAPRADLDAQVLIDANMVPLAASPQNYKQYRAALREEFANLDDLTYFKARRWFVRSMLSRDSLFRTPAGRSREDAARSNLEMELAKLNCLITKADPTDAGADEDEAAYVDSEFLVGANPSDTGTLIIKKRPLRKNICAVDDEPTSTGMLPVLQPASDPSRSAADSDEDGASSLETAFDAMDLPSPTPKEPRDTAPGS